MIQIAEDNAQMQCSYSKSAIEVDRIVKLMSIIQSTKLKRKWVEGDWKLRID